MDNHKSFADECLAGARIAMNNHKFKEAKDILMPAYQQMPDNTEVLKMMGGLCILLGQFEEAAGYYSQNIQLEPDNGDSYYLMGNAYFTNGRYQKAFDAYITAEEKGCSEKVKPKLYYQMGLICSLKGDRQAALIHFQQYEDTDPSGMVALDESFLSEKLKIYMRERDAENALKCARQLLNIKPENYNYYGLVFNLLMVRKCYTEAEELLDKAQKYLKLSYEQRLDLAVQRAMLYIDLADTDKEEQKVKNLSIAKSVLEKAQRDPEIKADNFRELNLMIAEIYLKGSYYKEACQLAEKLITDQPLRKVPDIRETEAYKQEILNDGALWNKTKELVQDEEYRQQQLSLQLNPARVKEILEGNDAAAAPAEAAGTDPAVAKTRKLIEQMAQQPESSQLMSEGEFNDRLNNVLVSCYIDADHFELAGKYAALLKNSKKAPFANFGYYAAAFSARKLAEQGKCDKEAAEQLYQQAISHYKKRIIEDATDETAVMFRVRLYAENGKYAMAEQVASMLNDNMMHSLKEYIDSCRKASSGAGSSR